MASRTQVRLHRLVRTDARLAELCNVIDEAAQVHQVRSRRCGVSSRTVRLGSGILESGGSSAGAFGDPNANFYDERRLSLGGRRAQQVEGGIRSGTWSFRRESR